MYWNSARWQFGSEDGQRRAHPSQGGRRCALLQGKSPTDLARLLNINYLTAASSAITFHLQPFAASLACVALCCLLSRLPFRNQVADIAGQYALLRGYAVVFAMQ